MKLQTLKEAYSDSSIKGDGFDGYFNIDYSYGSFTLNVHNAPIQQMLKSDGVVSALHDYNLPKDVRYAIMDELEDINDKISSETREVLKEITQAYISTIHAIMINSREKLNKELDNKIKENIK